MKITVIGAGYVGLVTAACFADLGNEVLCVEKVSSKLEKLCRGISPIYEPGLTEMLQKNIKEGRIHFTDKIEEGVNFADTIFLCVGTPQGDDGKADLSQVEEASRQIAQHMTDYKLIIEKSTVPVNTHQWVKKTVKRYIKNPDIPFDVASNPEFLREGSAIYDFMNPDRIVVGVESKRARKIMEELYRPFTEKGFPLLITTPAAAELIKHASNSFLAMKISYINMIADLCEKVGADINEVADGMGYDKRIGRAFLNAGIGYGGSCFHPEEVVFVNRGDGVEALTFEELFEIGKSSELRNVKILSADNNGFSEYPLQMITVRDYEDEMVELTLSMGRKIKVTKDHPVLIYKNEEIKTVLAEEVKAGDNILVPVKSGKEYEREVEIDVIKELSKDLSLLERTLIHSYQLVEENFEKIKKSGSYRHPYDVKRTGSVRLSTVLDAENTHLPKGRLFTSRSRSCHIPTKITINRDFARLLGYFAAEGWISEDTGRSGVKRKRIGFTFGADEREYISDLKNILSSLDIHFTERISGNSHTVLVSSNILAYIFENVLKTGTNSYDKKIPPQIFISPPYIKEEYLKGLFRGDGCITRLNNDKNLCIELATVSKKLAHSIVILLQHLGIVASFKEKFFKGSKVKTYLLRINGIENVERVGTWFGKKWKNYTEIAKNYKRKIKPTGYKIDKNFAVLKVKSVKKEYYKGQVYSVETGNSCLISSCGIYIHNCFPKDVKAFIKIAEDHGLDFGLLKETEKINRRRREQFIEKIESVIWISKDKNIAVWGLSFKPNTDDIREAPAIDIVKQLKEAGSNLKLYDPKAMENFKQVVPEGENVKYVSDKYEAVKDADLLVLITEWDEFKQADMEKVKQLMRLPIVIDGRNVYQIEDMKRLGFEYYSIGRS